MWVTPGAERSAVSGVRDGRLRLKLAAPAREGKANAELVRFLAGVLGVPRTAVVVSAGATGRRKVVKISGLTGDEFRDRLPY